MLLLPLRLVLFLVQVIEFLHRVLDIMGDYFGGNVDESAIKESFSLVYQLLEEMMDNGHPLTTEPNALKAMIRPPTTFVRMVTAATGKVMLRKTCAETCPLFRGSCLACSYPLPLRLPYSACLSSCVLCRDCQPVSDLSGYPLPASHRSPSLNVLPQFLFLTPLLRSQTSTGVLCTYLLFALFVEQKETPLRSYLVLLFDVHQWLQHFYIYPACPPSYCYFGRPSLLVSTPPPPPFFRQSNVSDVLPDGTVSAMPWRKAGVKYSQNEVYLDIVEELDAILNVNGQVS